MDLITTHISADFDALGSLVAAKKLYPDSRLLLPGSQEKAVRDFLALAKDSIVVESEKECDLRDIGRLILVDTRHRSRIGIASELIDKGVTVHIYDHHPRMKGDIVADKDVYGSVGATVTILADLIKRKRIALTYLEATIMLLGIYEETGSLTYRTTTRSDVDMVSFLLSQGANLSVVASYLNRELSEEELSFLTKLLNATERISVKGISVATIEIDGKSYTGELGMLIHKLMDIENIPVLFIFIKVNDGRTDIIARSKVTNVDVNKILSHFGGGGHPSAASAKVRGSKAASVKEMLIRVLKSNIRVRIYAKDIMSADLKPVSLNKKVSDAKKILLDKGISGLPVVDKGEVAGVITLGALNKAMKHGFGHARVKGYMSTGVATVRENTPLHAVHNIMVKSDAAAIPVVKGREMVGVITRTDVLKRVHNELLAKPGALDKKVVLNLSKKMKAVFPKRIMSLLRFIGRLADRRGFSAFVVGGLVRDLLLGTGNLDLDIVVEGDAIDFGDSLAKELKGTLVVHKRFRTATVITGDRIKIDLATARKEIYDKPAALPTVVEFGSLKNDLIRRDFTINAMAVGLNRGNFGQLIDFFGGEQDLMRGRIRVMHDSSFMDDPTRIFRAVRFEQRFSFAIDKYTSSLILNAIEEEMFEKVEPQRIRDEIILILKEREPLKSLNRMAELHEFRFIHHKIAMSQDMKRLYKAIDDACLWYEKGGFKKRILEKWLIYLMALFEPLNYNEVVSICNRFVFKRGERMRILSYKRYGDKAARILGSKRALSPSKIYRVLKGLSYEVILLIMAKSDSKPAKGRIKDFLGEYNLVRTKIKGDDIRRIGLAPGPFFKTILKRILHRKIDGALKTKKDEVLYAKRLIEKR